MPTKRSTQKGGKSEKASDTTLHEVTVGGALEEPVKKKARRESTSMEALDVLPCEITDGGALEHATAVQDPSLYQKPAGLDEAKFEDLFGHPLTHQTGMLMLNNLVVGSSASQTTSGPQVGSCELSVKDDAVPGPSPKQPSPAKLSSEGVGMISELWSRYETNKRKALHGNQEPKKICDDPDDDNYDIEAVYSQTFENEEDDDFLKYTVPQYDLKKKLCGMHYSAVERMSRAETVKACKCLIPVLKGILNETVPSKRHDIFKKCGLSRMELNKLAITEPFQADQHYECSNMIISALSPDGQLEKSSGKFMYYVSDVMIPECFVRIYAQVNKVSIEFAEKELRFGPSYDGQLDEELIKTLPIGNDSTDKVK